MTIVHLLAVNINDPRTVVDHIALWALCLGSAPVFGAIGALPILLWQRWKR